MSTETEIALRPPGRQAWMHNHSGWQRLGGDVPLSALDYRTKANGIAARWRAMSTRRSQGPRAACFNYPRLHDAAL